MKKLLPRLLAACLLAIVLMLPTRAQAAGVSLTGGTGGLRPGSTVTLTLSVSGSNLVAINGAFSGTQGMSLSSVTSARSGWQIGINGNNFTAYDTTMTNPVGSSAAIFTATFKINSNAASGSTVSTGVAGVTASDGENTLTLGSATWSATIAAPLSTNNNLSALSCSNAPLSPAFSAGTVYYSVTVPYSVTALNLNYTRADSTASVTVSGNSLVVGSNTVTITVTAQNGAKKSYYITATRQQDPDYQPSTNALLQSLTPSGGTLSPAFDPEVTDYVLYVPYETEEFSLSGVAQDGKARSVTNDSGALEEGDNELTVTCTAEDAVTVQTYTVHVYRMPLYEGELPQIISPAEVAIEIDPEIVPEEEPTLWEQALALAQTGVMIPYLSDYTGELPLWGLAAAALLVVILLFYLLGTLVGKAAGRRKTLRRLAAEAEAPSPEDDAPDGGGTPPAPEPPEPPTEPAKDAEPEPPSAPAEEPDAPAEAETTEADDLVRTMSLNDLINDIKNM